MFKKTALALAASSAFLLSGAVNAIPVDPSEINVAKHFSPDMQDKYYLYADSSDSKLVWYIPKTGFVASKGRGDRIAPYFNASETTPRFGIWSVLRPGESQIRMGGAFNTTGDIASLNILKSEASNKGYNIAPAVVTRAKSTFIAEGIDINADGRVDVHCDQEPHVIDGIEITINVCKVTAADGTDIETSTIERAYFKAPQGRTSVSARIPFQILTLPDADISSDISGILMDGGSLDQYFQFVVDWELETARPTRVGRITIDWNQTFQQASTFAAIHYNSCLEVEVSTFFKKLVQEGKGVYVEYLHPDGSYRREAPNGNENAFIEMVEAVRAEMQDELFDQVREYSQSQLGQVSTNVNSMFTLRANYEKQILKRNETRYVNWNPGMSMENAQTNMGIDCVRGGFGLKVEWNDSPECQAVIEDITETN